MVMEHPNTALRLGDAPNGKSFMFFSVFQWPPSFLINIVLKIKQRVMPPNANGKL